MKLCGSTQEAVRSTHEANRKLSGNNSNIFYIQQRLGEELKDGDKQIREKGLNPRFIIVRGRQRKGWRNSPREKWKYGETYWKTLTIGNKLFL